MIHHQHHNHPSIYRWIYSYHYCLLSIDLRGGGEWKKEAKIKDEFNRLRLENLLCFLQRKKRIKIVEKMLFFNRLFDVRFVIFKQFIKYLILSLSNQLLPNFRSTHAIIELLTKKVKSIFKLNFLLPIAFRF